MFNVLQALRGLEQRSSSLVDMVSNSTGRTVDVMYATLVHRCGPPSVHEMASDLHAVAATDKNSAGMS